MLSTRSSATIVDPLPGERAGERAAGNVLGTPLSRRVNGIS